VAASSVTALNYILIITVTYNIIFYIFVSSEPTIHRKQCILLRDILGIFSLKMTHVSRNMLL